MAPVYEQSRRTILSGVIFFVVLFGILISVFLLSNSPEQIKSEILLEQIQDLEKKIQDLERNGVSPGVVEINKINENELSFTCKRRIKLTISLKETDFNFILDTGLNSIKIFEGAQNKLVFQNPDKNAEIYFFENIDAEGNFWIKNQLKLVLPNRMTIIAEPMKNQEIILGFIDFPGIPNGEVIVKQISAKFNEIED